MTEWAVGDSDSDDCRITIIWHGEDVDNWMKKMLITG
jgi:hypothetical protein